MKKTILLIFILLLFGCEDVIQVDVESSEPRIVIEARISNSLNKNFVKITESTDYFNPNTYKVVSGAEVKIKENNKTEYLLEETAAGIYKSPQLVAVPQNQYSITVNVKGKKYTAESYVPSTINIDSISYQIKKRPFKKEKFLELHVYFQDNKSQKDFARFVIYKNGEKIRKIFLYNDRLTNGNYVNYFFFNFDKETFKFGDKIFVEMQSIDEQTYKYFKTLRDATAQKVRGPLGAAAPANPETNWNNNALGFFSTFTISTGSVVLKIK